MLLENDGNQLHDESLGTFMCEAEATINKKTLTGGWPADPDSLATLKPNYLLTMKSKIVLPTSRNFQNADMYPKDVVDAYNT